MDISMDKGVKVFQPINETDSNSISNYAALNSKEAFVFNLLSMLARFKDKSRFKWHFSLQVEAQFDYLNHNKIKTELDLQEQIDVSLTTFLETHCDAVKIVSYLKGGYYHYHWYLTSSNLDYAKFESWFQKQTINNRRALKFNVFEDPDWKNIMKHLVEDGKTAYGWAEYLSDNSW